MSHTHYYFESEQSKYDQFLHNRPRILYTGLVTNVENWFSEAGSHVFHELLYFYKGAGSVFLNGMEHGVKSGDLIIYHPGVLHREETSSKNPFQFVFLAYDMAGAPEIMPGGEAILNTCTYRYKLENLFFELLNEASSHVEGYEVICDSLLAALIIQISRIKTALAHERQTSSDSQRLKDFIDSNFDKDLTLDTLSEVVYVSKHHLAHMFKNEIGIPPITYLISKRMDEAKRLLTQSDMSIAEISKIVGYENPNYFSQLFKKLEGTSPLAYRQGEAGPPR